MLAAYPLGMKSAEEKTAPLKTDKGRLTAAGVAHIRKLRAEDPKRWTYQALAAELGVCLTTVYNVCKQRTHGDA